MRVLLTGGTGFIGLPLIEHLQSLGHETRVLTRDLEQAKAKLPKGCQAFKYGPQQQIPLEALADVNAVIHLAGENVGSGFWTKLRKKLILESRTFSTRALVEAMANVSTPPQIFLSASAIGYYGDTGDAWVTEEAPNGKGFLAEVVKAWEQEIFAAEKLGIRVAALRLGVVMGHGGALAKMLMPYRLGLGTIMGSGNQYMSWVHLKDVIGLFAFALENPVKGPLNVCAPLAITQSEFSYSLTEILHRPLFFRIPAFILKWALGEMSTLFVNGQRVSVEKALRLGYVFRYPNIDRAISEILIKN
jgi:uncharacterized protein